MKKAVEVSSVQEYVGARPWLQSVGSPIYIVTAAMVAKGEVVVRKSREREAYVYISAAQVVVVLRPTVAAYIAYNMQYVLKY